MKIFLVSDLHVFSKVKANSEAPSHICALPGKKTDLSNRKLADELFELIQKEKIEADCLICCGDLAEKADEKGLELGYKIVRDLKEAVGAGSMVITAGNHDVDSRFTTSKGSPTEYLKAMEPSFPTNVPAEYNEFWANDYFIRDTDDTRFLVINTAAAHGYRDQHEHGLVSDLTLKKIAGSLASLPSKLINICVCHHHPQRHSELGLGEFDDIQNGQLLLDLLGAPNSSQWIVIHGHKHHPKLSYSQGSSLSPIVFSAGSVSARLFPQLQDKARNQFYLLDFEPDQISRWNRLVGQFRAWSWFATEGWVEAGDKDGLPRHGGFGYRDVQSLAHRVSSGLAIGQTEWSKLTTSHPEIAFLTPADLRHFTRILASTGIGISDQKLYPAFLTKT